MLVLWQDLTNFVREWITQAYIARWTPAEILLEITLLLELLATAPQQG